MKDDDIYSNKYYAQFLSLEDHEYVFSGTYYDSDKQTVCCQKNVILSLLLKQSNIF